ncbi:MAG: hypothetical protein ND895_16990 [Pyrinomonadaceae bacterium]|nr:hypothetical protein [Pyrinomonadaceae bacterium]
MRSANTYHQSKQVFSLLTICLMCASASALLAQSGRKQTETASPTVPQAGRDDKRDQVPPPAFIVLTSAPERSRYTGAHAGYAQPPSLEYQARGGCLLALRKIRGAKVSEDEDVARWEARETARTENKAWVIWMELRWDKTISTYDPTPFRLRYLLFEPRTGRIAASGVGRGVKHAWGKGQPLNISLEEQLRQAGRDIAAQVVSELKIGQ